MHKMYETLKANKHIQDIKYKAGNKVSGETKAFMKAELAKNKKIMDVLGVNAAADELSGPANPNLTTINLRGKGLVEASWLSKMMSDYNFLQELNLSNNNLGPEGAQDVAAMIIDNAERGHTIKKVDISDNNIGPSGLQAFCSVLVEQKNSGLVELDIQRNNIPDKSLKALLALVFENT